MYRWMVSINCINSHLTTLYLLFVLLGSIDLVKGLRLEDLPDSVIPTGYDFGESQLPAYTVYPTAKLSDEGKNLCPVGLPEEFSLLTTFRLDEFPQLVTLLNISGDGGVDLAITVDTVGHHIMFECSSVIAKFELGMSKLKENAWHKMGFVISKSNIALTFDGKSAGEAALTKSDICTFRCEENNIHMAQNAMTYVSFQGVTIRMCILCEGCGILCEGCGVRMCSFAS